MREEGIYRVLSYISHRLLDCPKICKGDSSDREGTMRLRVIRKSNIITSFRNQKQNFVPVAQSGTFAFIVFINISPASLHSLKDKTIYKSAAAKKESLAHGKFNTQEKFKPYV